MIKEGAIESPRTVLNPAIFPDGKTIDPEVIEKLIEFYTYVISECPFDLDGVEDVHLVGSNLSYQYSEYSDLDLHILIDIENLSLMHNFSMDEMSDILKLFAKSITSKGFTVKGYAIELFFQNFRDNMEERTPGIYSLKYEKWIKYPEHTEEYSEDMMQRANLIALDLSQILHNLISIGNSHVFQYEDATAAGNKRRQAEAKKGILAIIDDIEKWKSKVKDDRHSSISNAGMYSMENLVFKLLQRMGDIQDAVDAIDKLNKTLYKS